VITHVRAFAVGGEFDSGEVREKMKREHPSLLVQTLRTDASSNERHLEVLAAQTMHASSAGNLVAKKPEIDFLLRVAGTTQISKAIRRVGSRTNEPFLLVVAGKRKISKRVSKPGWKALARRELSEKELDRIEVAALLNAVRPRSPASA
jgi:tRNA threonylcarbamoyladenosine modification (KEOPS) complex Cgi121 subunit